MNTKRFTTRLVYRNGATHTPLMEQKFDRVFTSKKTAEKFIESKVAGMKCISMEVDIRIFGQIINENGKIETGIALF